MQAKDRAGFVEDETLYRSIAAWQALKKSFFTRYYLAIFLQGHKFIYILHSVIIFKKRLKFSTPMRLPRMNTACPVSLIFSFLLTALVLTGCSDESTSLSLPRSELPIISFQTFNIPQFPTARDQLNYAKSGFPSHEEKKAALEIIFELFPTDKVECGNAALDIAYMNFGYDYRFAKKQYYTNAISAYQDVIEDFKEYPQIIAKAYWYLGWIHCDLLQEKEVGVTYFRHIVKTYPDIKTGISSPVPWVSLVYPLAVDAGQPAKDHTQKQWACLALLEIVRHAHDKTEVFKAFTILWEKYRNTVSTGLAIKLLLKDTRDSQKILPYVKPYLALNIADRYLVKEIKERAKEY